VLSAQLANFGPETPVAPAFFRGEYEVAFVWPL